MLLSDKQHGGGGGNGGEGVVKVALVLMMVVMLVVKAVVPGVDAGGDVLLKCPSMGVGEVEEVDDRVGGSVRVWTLFRTNTSDTMARDARLYRTSSNYHGTPSPRRATDGC